MEQTGRVFLDTSYVVALSSKADENHSRAKAAAETIRTNRRNLITTRLILVEIGDGLSKLNKRGNAALLLKSLENDTKLQIFELTEEVYQKGVDLFSHRADKEWGMTDCISFVVMQENSVVDALTADEHFTQAGFNALLR